MFTTIILTLLCLSLAAEWYIYRTVLHSRPHTTLTVYYIATSLAIAPYFTLVLMGRMWDLFSAFLSVIGGVGVVLFILNTICKLCWVVALLLRNNKRARVVRTSMTIVAVVGCLLVLYGYTWERFQLRTTHIEIAFDNLPAEADGLRIAQIGDLHIGLRPNRHQLLRQLTEEIARQKPDLVIDCGDMVNSRYSELDSLSMAILGSVEAPLGIYTTIGNHDNGDYIRDTITLPRQESLQQLIERQAAMGWNNIAGESIPLQVGGDTLYLTALNYPENLEKGSHGQSTDEDYTSIFTPLPEDGFNIVIAHTPIVWNNILAATSAELTLSGHVHAMQMRIPPLGEGRGWSPASFVYPHWSGLYRYGNCALHITDGVGSSLPIRVGVKPQLVIITLRSESRS